MARGKPRAELTLLDVLIDGFEKNEILDGFHWRNLPMPDEPTAAQKFAELAEEAGRWKGAPSRSETASGRSIVAWRDLEIRQAGRGIMVRIRAPGFADWWHDPQTWQDDPMAALYDWLEEERTSVQGTSL